MASISRENRPQTPWRVQWSERGHRRTRRFATRKDAEKFVGDLARGHNPTGASVTVAAWLATWIRTHGPRWEPQTLKDRAARADRFIIPALGGIRLRDLTRRDVRDWRNDMLRVTTDKQANRAVRDLSAALSSAVEDEMVAINVCIGMKRLDEEEPDRRPALLWEVEGIRAAMRTPRDRLAVSLMAYGALRPGEMRTVRWEDVLQATIRVHRGERRSGNTKTGRKGSRSVPIIGVIREDLEAMGRRAGGMVCGPLNGDAWRANQWQTARLLAGSDATPYNLRHTAASLWIAEGRTPHEVAKLLGHSTPALTLSTYGHLFDEAQLMPNEDVQAAAERARADAAASIGEVIARNVAAARERVDAALVAVANAKSADALAAARKERRAAKLALRLIQSHPLAKG